MNCEQAEDILSAYLDNILETTERTEVETHLAGCAECTETLAEYRRYDGLLREEPRMEAPEGLRARIFESEEFTKLLRELERGDDSEHDTPAASPGRRRATASWPRHGLQIAAALALVLGSALLVTQGLLHSSSPSSRRTQPITISGNGQQAPLAAGNRVVYLRAGMLWSAPENGVGVAQRLSPAGTRVAGWAVSPGGQLVAYIDAASGRIHVIRSDGQSDQLVGSSPVAPQSSENWNNAAGQAARGGIVWSPDGQQIAYVAATSPSTTTLRVMNADGTNDRAVDGAGGDALIATPVWSADSLRVAYTRSSQGTQSIWAYSEDLLKTQELAAQPDGSDANAMASQMAWLPDTVHPTLTWAATDGQSVTGLFAQPLLSSADPIRLDPDAARAMSASYSARGNGAWVVAGADGSLSMISASTPGSALTANVGNPLSAAVWSPAGDVAAYVTASGDLGFWTPGSAPVIVAHGVSGAPSWSADGKQLAVALPEGVLSVHVENSASVRIARISDVGGAVSFTWAPDGHALAIAAPDGVAVANADGSHERSVDSQAADTSALTWTVAK